MIFHTVEKSGQNVLLFFVTIHAFGRRTERRTNGQTDSFLMASPRWHSMQCGKIPAISCRKKEFKSFQPRPNIWYHLTVMFAIAAMEKQLSWQPDMSTR